MQDAKPLSQRRHDSEFKQLVLARCADPGASVAQVALAHGLNANLVHKWRRLSDAAAVQSAAAEFIPVTLVPTPVAVVPAPPMEPDLQRGALCVRVRWPASESSACAAWLRELLR